MTEETKALKGSTINDEYRWRRKQELPKAFYGLDADYMCVSKNPPGIVAVFDIKRSAYEPITFSEAVAYNSLVRKTKVYILVSLEGDDQPVGMFQVFRYYGAYWQPEPPKVDKKSVRLLHNWKECEEWEGALRKEYEEGGGWKNLKVSEKYAQYIC